VDIDLNTLTMEEVKELHAKKLISLECADGHHRTTCSRTIATMKCPAEMTGEQWKQVQEHYRVWPCIIYVFPSPNKQAQSFAWTTQERMMLQSRGTATNETMADSSRKMEFDDLFEHHLILWDLAKTSDEANIPEAERGNPVEEVRMRAPR
jgi:hypothetical protein